ncbi:MFS transporter [Corynebacterium sp. TAE3-ERU12]|uniref:MFS transporter n=1 Tax=Corynebacterium sp. TAE3-ERU12 TaxID=2849491 RepID=UPI001C491746|nr:MFS transporter [Corynebacterium sp. TAE3-ERU12]MBV7294955.1 MFS transporter [Corynebacterium sp. TAE3-ERU12]
MSSGDTHPTDLVDQPADHRPAVSRGWITRYGLLYLGQNTSWAAPAQLLLAQQILVWYPGEKEQKLALLMAIGGVASLIGHPLAGWLSDVTPVRFGRRSTWIACGGLVASACLIVMAHAPGFATLVAAWTVFQLFIAASINAAQAVAPDVVPTRQYGTVSGVLGLTYTMGLVLGTAVATLLDIQAAYTVTAVLVMVAIIQFLIGFRDPARDDTVRADVSVGKLETPDLAKSPPERSYRDFNWVFITRFLVTAGNYVALFYLFYFLRDRIGLADPDSGVLVLTGIYAVCVVVTAMVSGPMSDKSGKRRIYVGASSAGVAAACVLMAWATSFAIVIGGALVLGLAWGVFMAVDQALINEVLPSADRRGRDMGIMNLAVAGPNTLAPVLAAAALTGFGGYPGLYLFAAGLTLIGAVLIRQVRTVT